jgi:hypothetical protein
MRERKQKTQAIFQIIGTGLVAVNQEENSKYINTSTNS